VEEREKIEQKLKADALGGYINDLVDSANVSYLNEKGEKLELTHTPDSTH
jgi:hypothetical protein